MHLANLSFSQLELLDVDTWAAENVAALTPDTIGLDGYFPERRPEGGIANAIRSGYGDRVLETVAEALFECLMFLELSDDEAVDPDNAVRVMETVMHLLGQLSTADRYELIRLAEAQGAREASSVRREFLLMLPQAFGLVEED